MESRTHILMYVHQNQSVVMQNIGEQKDSNRKGNNMYPL